MGLLHRGTALGQFLTKVNVIFTIRQSCLLIFSQISQNLRSTQKVALFIIAQANNQDIQQNRVGQAQILHRNELKVQGGSTEASESPSERSYIQKHYRLCSSKAVHIKNKVRLWLRKVCDCLKLREREGKLSRWGTGTCRTVSCSV